MRDANIYDMINKSNAAIIDRLSGIIGQMKQEMATLQFMLITEALRRQALEEELLEKLVGGVNKEALETRFKAKVEKYEAEMIKRMEESKKQTQAQPQPSGIVDPSGAPVTPTEPVVSETTPTATSEVEATNVKNS